MLLEYFFLGLIVKAIASFGDFLTRVPLIAGATRTRKGKIAFSLGSLAAVFLVIILAMIFSAVIAGFSHSRLISAILIFILAALVYFNVFTAKPQSWWELIMLKAERLSAQRLIKLTGLGFIISFIALIDDTVVFAGLFLNKESLMQYWIAIGIMLATIGEVILIIYFSEKIEKLKYKKELATLGLIVVGIFILLGFI